MVKRRISKQLFRAVVLITFGVVLFTVAPANRATPVPIPSPAASPTPTQASEVKLTALPTLIMGCRSFRSSEPCSYEREVKLSATVESPEEKKLRFTWAVSAGRLKGKGSRVTWDISGLGEGTYTAMVDVTDTNHHTVSSSAVIRILPCATCDPPPCPTVSVACPSEAESKQEIEFIANVAGGDVDIRRTYKWSVSAGKITRGRGTSKISLDVSELAGKSVTATVKVGGFDPKCTGTQASCTVLAIK